MSELVNPTDVRFFCSCVFNQDAISSIAEVKDLIDPIIEHDYSFESNFNPLFDYYSKEMGPNLRRIFFWDDKPKRREELWWN